MAVPPYTDDELAMAEIAFGAAEALFREELKTADTIDLKAVGLATADVAALTILVSFHKDVAHWWLSAALLTMAGACFFLVMWQRYWELGIQPRPFWDDNSGKNRRDLLEIALATTEWNRTHNDPFLKSKAFWFLWGYRALASGLVVLLGTTLWHAYA